MHWYYKMISLPLFFSLFVVPSKKEVYDLKQLKIKNTINYIVATKIMSVTWF